MVSELRVAAGIATNTFGFQILFSKSQVGIFFYYCPHYYTVILYKNLGNICIAQFSIRGQLALTPNNLIKQAEE